MIRSNLLLFLILFTLFIFSLFIGPAKVIEKDVILNIRLPRILTVIFSGSLLGLSGLLTQTLFRNPIAEPYLLGISSGAALGAFIADTFLPSIPYKNQVLAFLFSQITVILVILISIRNGFLPREILLLSGIALSLLLSSLLSFLIFTSPSERIKIFFWFFGSFSFVEWREFIIIFFSFSFFLFVLIFNLNKYDLLLLSDEESISMGINLKFERIYLSLLIAFATGVVVSMTGIIGFVGLIVPHIGRMIEGSGKHIRIFFPVTIIGAIILLLCDNFSRLLLRGAEIPVGVFTSLLGVPFFLFLLFRGRRVNF
ncbi:MAG: iron ABC transporter permease [Candidatus Hydrothermales bacterium]